MSRRVPSPSSDRVYGYQRRSRPRRSCRWPAVTWLPWIVFVRAGLGAQCAPAPRSAAQRRPDLPRPDPTRPAATPGRPGRPAARPTPGGPGHVREPPSVPRVRRTRRAQGPGGPASQVSIRVEVKPGVGGQAHRHFPSPAGRIRGQFQLSRRGGRNATRGGSTGSAAGSPGRRGGSGTAGIGAEGAGAANAVLASRPSSAVERPPTGASGRWLDQPPQRPVRTPGRMPRHAAGPGSRPAPDHGCGRAREIG